MTHLEDLKTGASVKGVLSNSLVTVVQTKWHGSNVVELTYKDTSGNPGCELLYRDREPDLEIVSVGLPWSFDADGSMFRLISEANRIRMAYLFDPLLAVHTSLVEPLPHQITAVYDEMLPRHPLRFLLADDPGAGKTIMAGLLIKELLIRGDLRRCLICCPGNLAWQWQDELDSRFHLPFDILSRQMVESSRTGNPFTDLDRIIVRLDQVSRNEDLQAKLGQTDWDLIVCDEAHKMSAAYFGGEVKYTKRYHLGQLLSQITRHFLLMTATPHNGKEEDFQLFMALLDGDRFEGRFRDGVHTVDASDLMRRMVKEDILKFDGTPLFPERRAYTVNYSLSPLEAALYNQVTEYVREEFNRADRLLNSGRRGTVSFALMTLQRRLASSPEAIYQSLKRRKERLEKRLREEKLLKRGADARIDMLEGLPIIEEDDIADFEDAPSDEVEDIENQVLDRATAAQTITELELEIDRLKDLEALGLKVKKSGRDRKWEELSELLDSEGLMFDSRGGRRKLVIFTEYRATLEYLADRIRTLLGKPDAVVTIYGNMGREWRKTEQARFTQDKDALILVATDAAGEGINLQRAHLMVNYDLPWNPNRLEQRFGRIHRIGQTDVCHLWNLVSSETREGAVYDLLLRKLEVESNALGGKVFDILGKVVFENKSLRDLLLEAIRYGDRPDVKERLDKVVDDALDRDHLISLLEEKALAHDSMNVSKVMAIKEEMERANVRRLQPHFVASFFMEAFKHFGGTVRERESKRYELTHVPAIIRNRDREIGRSDAVLPRYERITFEKDLISMPGKPEAEFVCPGHPLLEATRDLLMERYRDLLRQGAMLVDASDPGEEPRVLVYLSHALQDGRTDRSGKRRVISKRMQFLEVLPDGAIQRAGYAPYLDYRPAAEEEMELAASLLEEDWLKEDLEEKAVSHAIETLVPEHLAEVKSRKEKLVDKTLEAVKERLTKEINYWDHRANELMEQEQAGKFNAKINSAKARLRADDLAARLERRTEELVQERNVSPLPPVVIGGALVIPQGYLDRLGGAEVDVASVQERARIERMAMMAVMERERALGREPRDVSAENCGYDIESKAGKGRLKFIEVKGRVVGATTVTVSKNEVLTCKNKPEDYILAVVMVDGEETETHYVPAPFSTDLDFGVVSVNYSLKKLLDLVGAPA